MIDADFSIVMDYLYKGSVVRPNHYLVNRVNIVKFNVIEHALIYTMRLETIALLSMDHPELR